MKALPVVLTPDDGYKACTVEEATHVTIRMPGPTGILTLPVIRRGTREGTGCWSWNGSIDKPTLKPSVRTRYSGSESWVCHSWINDGVVQFLGDSTHDLANQSVPLLDVGDPNER